MSESVLVHAICGHPVKYVGPMPRQFAGDFTTIWHMRCEYCDADFTSNDTGEYDFV